MAGEYLNYWSHCQPSQVYNHGQSSKGHDRFRCSDYYQVLQLPYTYKVRKPDVKEQITEILSGDKAIHLVFQGAI